MKMLRLLLTLLIVALVIVACGGGDDNSSDSTDNDTVETTDNTTQTEDDNTNEAEEVVEEPDATFDLIEFEPMATFGIGQVLSMALSPDDSQVAVGTGIGTIHLFDATDLSSTSTIIELGGRLVDIAYSPDGTQLAVANYFGSVHVIDIATGDIVWEGYPQRNADEDGVIVASIFDSELTPTRVAYSPDGATLAVAYDDSGKVTLFDAGTGENGRILDGRTPITNVPQLAFTPDSTQLIASHGNGDVDVFDATSGELVVRREDELTLRAMTVSPDSSTIATINTQSGSARFLTTLNVSDLTTAVEIQNDNFGDALIYSVDGASLITTTGRTDAGAVLVYDIATLTQGARFITNLPVNDLALSSDGTTLYISDPANVYAIDATALLAGDAETIIEEALGSASSNDWIVSVDFTADLSQIIICERNGKATIFDVDTGENLQSAIALPPENTNGCTVTFTEDENVITMRRGTQGYGYNLETGETLFNYRSSNARAISGNGLYALGAFTSTLNMFDFNDAPTDGSLVEPAYDVDLETLNISRATTGAQAINFDGTRAMTLTTVEGGASALILNPSAGETLMQLPVWENRISSFSLSDDGSTVAIAGYEDLGLDGDRIIINIYDITGDEATILAEIPLSDPINDELRVRSIAVSNNGGLVAILADDGIMHLWDRETGEIVASFFVGLNFNGLTFQANSPYLIGYDGNNFITIDPNLYGVATVWDMSDYLGEIDMPEAEATEESNVEMTAEATEESE